MDLGVEARRALMQDACETEFLVLDDLGAERTTEWVREQLGIIMNERWANRRATIVTTNQKLDYFADTLGHRAVSRLEAMVNMVEVDGRDRRAL
jgi:DNA replication protein DnaC